MSYIAHQGTGGKVTVLAQAPLLSIRARAQIGKSVVYRTRQGRNVVSAKSRPTDPRSPAQLTQRAKIARTVKFWKEQPFDTWTKDSWLFETQQKSLRMAPYQAFVKLNGNRPLSGLVPSPVNHRNHYWWTEPRIQTVFRDLNTGGEPGDIMDVERWLGTSPNRIERISNGRIRADGLMVTAWPAMPVSDLYYYYNDLSGNPISGIFRWLQ